MALLWSSLTVDVGQAVKLMNNLTNSVKLLSNRSYKLSNLAVKQCC